MTRGSARIRRISTTLAGALFGAIFLAGALAPAASAASASPATGPTSGGTVVTVSGSNFSQTYEVTVDGAAVGYSVVNDSTVHVTMPSHPAGATTIVVNYMYQTCLEEMPGWGCVMYGEAFGTQSANYTYESGPAVSSVSPTSGPTAGGTAVVITGANFSGVTGVLVGGVAAPFTAVSSTQINATMPAHSAGAVSVEVIDAYGNSTLSNAYTYDAPPAITGISVSTGSTSGGTQVTITGTNLTPSTSVTFGGTTALVTSASSTSISVSTPAHAAGAVNVEASNSYGNSTLSNAFTYAAPPTITTVSPSAGSTNGGTTVTLTGTNFTGTTKVTVGSVAVSYTVASATSITFKTPSSAAGAFPIAVTTPYGSVTASTPFTYGQSPTVSSISPNRGDTSASVTIPGVVITGANFTGTTAVTFGGVNATTFTVNSATQITATAPANNVAGSYDVVVTTPDGSATVAGGFTYGNAPTISTVSPNDGPVGQIIPSVIIKGANFTGATGVTFGGVAGTSLVVNSATQITVNAPSNASAGAVSVAVTTGYGTATLTNGFTYGTAPAITSVSTRTGTTNGGTTLTITGSNLSGVTSVQFGGVNAASFTVNSATQITATTPAHAAGAVNVTAADAFGTATLNSGFTYGASPTITSAVLSSGSTSGGATVTITGTNLTDASVVQFAGVNASSYVVNSATQITAITASTSVKTGTVMVTTPYGSYSLANGYSYGNPPVVTSISPAFATAGATKAGIVITGTDLTGASVTFDSTAATSVVVNSSTQLTVTAPALSAGTVNVVVTTGYGTDTLTNAFTYGSAPTVSSVSASTGTTSGGTSVTITGTNLTGATAVSFDGVPASAYTVASATSITATTPAHAAGAVTVAVTTKYGTGSSASAYTYAAPPTISTISPAKGSTAGGTSVTITGTNFSSVSGAAGVKFNGVNAASYTVNSATQITAVTPAGSAGTVNLTVSNTGGTATLNSAFAYGAPPTVTSVSSATGSTSGSTSVTITGTNLSGATAVTFGGVEAVSFSVVSATSITAVTPAHAAGAVAVAVTTPYATGTTSSAYTYGAPPALTSVSPTHGSTSSTTASVVLTGANLTGASSVTFGGTAATSIVVNSATQITLTAPVHAAGAVDVVVTTPYGTTTLASGFTYTAAPTITSLSPTSGSTSGGTTVTINGASFGGVTTVAIGGNLATITANTGTVLTVTTPANTSGVKDVVITNPGGSTTSANAFTYDAPPTVTGNSPSTTSTAGGATITLTGTNFTGATGVTVGGTAATGLAVASATSLSFTAPAHAAGAVDIVVTTPYGSGTRSGGLTYGAPPTVSTLSPSAGTTSGGESVVITGTNLTGATAVTFGGTNATSFTVNSATQITAVAPAKSAGAATLVVTTPYGSATVTNGFVYGSPPALASISPNTGPTTSGTTVVLTGQNFSGATAVTFGGVPAVSGSINSATQITAVVPAGAAGAVSVEVTTPDGTTTLTNGYTYVAAPTVSAVSPSTGSTLGGTTLTLTGTNFRDVTSVTVGGSPATFTVDSTTSLTVTTPAHSAGSAPIVVTTGYGSVTSSNTFTYDAPPSITSLSTATGSTAGGTSVVITGANFTGATGVTFGGTAASSFTVNSSTQITAVAPAKSAGAVSLVVTSPYGTGSTTYTYGASPTISSLATTTGSTSGGTSVVITGANFTGATTVAFGGNLATFTVNSASQITATTPSNTAGAKDVVITTGYGTVTSSNAFTYGAPPTLTAASTTTGPTTGGTTVILTGTNLGSATSVKFGGIPAASGSVDSATQVTAVTPSDTAGPVTIQVVTPYGTASMSNGFTFGLAPTVEAITPNKGTASQTKAGVVITGANLTGATSVTFGGTAATITASSATELTVTAPSKSAGAVSVVITTPYGSDTVSNGFTYGAAPVVSTLSATTGTSAGGNTVTLTGSGFTGATEVTFGGENATFTVVSDTSITTTTPAHAAGAVDVVVTTAYGSGTKSSGYTYGNPPTVSSISPATGATTGATSVVITGTNFTGATAVNFGSTAAASYVVNSSTQITAVSPAGSAGAVNISVTTPYGTGTKTGAFTYGAAPTITSITGNTGSTAGGTSVKISGSHFTGASRVTFGSAAATSLVVVSDTEITVVTPANAPGGYTVTITTGYGPGSLANAFTYGNPPTLTTATPNHGTASATTANVVLAGTNLSGASVKFGSDPATITAASPTSLTVTAPSQAAGTVPIMVTTPYGSYELQNGFTYGSAPAITSLSVTSGSTNGGNSVVINGANLSGATKVTFGGTTATITANSASSVTATTPSHASGAVSVEVVTTYGNSTLSNAFTYYSPPVVSSVSPDKGSTMGFQTISVKGSNFTKISEVKFGGLSLPIVSVTSTEIQVQTMPVAAGTVSVQVVGSYGTSTLSNAFTYEAPPIINAVSPSHGDAGTTTANVIITGSYFSNASSVTFGGTTATFVVNSSTQITATAPNRSAGAVTVAVTTPGGTAQRSNGFTYGTAPTITSVTPKTGLGSTTNPGVVIAGANLSDASVTFGGSAGTVTASSASSLTVTAPPHADGAVNVVVTTAYGSATMSNGYTYGALPAVDELVPNSGSTLGGTRITISGANFTSSPLPTVTIGGVAATGVTYVNSEQITAVAPAHAAGAVSVVVATTFGSSTLTNGFTYDAPPTVTHVSPTTGLTSGGASVVVSGTGFTGATGVTFAGTPATSFTVDNSGEITAIAPAHAAGGASIAVTTPYGTGSLANAFTYGSPPTITAMSPRVGDANVTTPDIVITGTNLSGATVMFGSAAASVTSDEATSLTVTAPSQAAGSVDVVITTAFGSTTVNDGFSYGNLPGISLVTPSTGSTDGDRMVIIDGSFLSGATHVKFGSVDATSFTVQNSSQIVAITPPGSPGAVSVTVITPYGTVTEAGAYVYGRSPSITSISPDSGSTAGGETVTITGSNLTGTSTVLIGGVQASSVTVVSPTQVTAIAPASNPGARSIAVRTPYGITATPQAFTFVAPSGGGGGGGSSSAEPEVVDAIIFGGVCPVGWTTGYAAWANLGHGGTVCSAPAGTPIPSAINVAGATDSSIVNAAINKGVLTVVKHLKTTVTFEPNSSTLTPQAKSTLRDYAKKVNAGKRAVTTVEGVVEVSALNKAAAKLAQERADAVAAYLRTIGILGQVKVLPGTQEFDTTRAGFARVRSTVRSQRR